MAVRGRKPKPTALKVLEGNPGHRPLNKKEPMPKGRLPRCPDWLEDDAKKEWKRLGKVLAEMGMLTHLDMMAFAGYCQAYARWKGAEEFITQHGDMCGRRTATCSKCRRCPSPRRTSRSC